MTRRYREISFDAPLGDPPLRCDAYHAPSDGSWRLLVIPGTPCNKFLYQRLLRTAPPSIDVVVVNRAGFGDGHHRAFTDFDDQLKALSPLIEEGRKVVTLGVSYGGALALKAALENEAVKGAVAVSALIDEPHDYMLKLEKLGAEPGIEPLVPDRWKRVRKEIEGRRSQIGPLLGRLAELNKPVEIVHGDFDALVSRTNAQTLKEKLPATACGDVDIVPGGTHYLELQAPRRLHAAVRRVIDRVEAM